MGIVIHANGCNWWFDCIYFELLTKLLNILCHIVDFHLHVLAFHLPICEFQRVLI